MVTKTTCVRLVDRRSQLTRAQFIKDYRNPGIPVILTDLSKNWGASDLFSFDFFQQKVGHKKINIDDRDYTLYEFIERLKQSTRESPAPYPCILSVSNDFPELRPYLEPRPAITKPDRSGNPLLPSKLVWGIDTLADLEVFLGGPGGEFPILHYDLLGVHTFSTLLYGKKEFILYAPNQRQYLYPNPQSPMRSQIEDHHHPDFDKYPLFAQAVPIVVTLAPWETLFIPSGWYHTARSLTLTISTQFDLLCQSNWRFFVQECCRGKSPIKAALLYGYLVSLGACLSVWERSRRTRD